MNMRSIVPFSWGSCVGHGDHHWHNLAGLGSRHNGASKLGPGGVQGDRDSGPAAISTDGRFVAFDSSASNLVPGDINSREDVFVRDRKTGTTGE